MFSAGPTCVLGFQTAETYTAPAASRTATATPTMISGPRQRNWGDAGERVRLPERGPPCLRNRTVDPPPLEPAGGPPTADNTTVSSAGHSRGISSEAGGSIGSPVHGPSASTTSAGSWYRFAGFFAIILPTMASSSRGTSGRSVRSGSGSRL